MPALAAAALAFLLAAGDALAPGASSPPWDGRTWRRVDDAATGFSFEVPVLGFRVEQRHFDPKAPADQVRHSFTVWGPDRLEATIEVYDAPAGLDAAAYFEKHFSFLRDAGARVWSGRAGERPATFAARPAEPGMYAWRAAVFLAGPHALRVTCHDADDARAAAVFEHLLETLAAPGERR